MTAIATRKFRTGLAALCLAFSAFTVVHTVVVDYNKRVEAEQQQLLIAANGDITFSVHGDWGMAPSERNRYLILLLCVAGFFFSLWKRTDRLAASAYGVTLLLIYHWITWTVQALAVNESYMADVPYLLRIATPFDWTLFVLLAVTFIINTAFFLSPRRTLR